MGKSTVARMFADEGVPVWDADGAVHRLQGLGGELVEAIEAAFPGTTGPHGVDRDALGARVLADEEGLRTLEAIVHPAVGRDRARWLEGLRTASTAPTPTTPLKGRGFAVVLDIPLLFETGGDAQVDRTVVVSAPAEVQRARVLARPGMTEAKFAAILARQLPDAEKRARADHVIETGGALEETRAQVRALLAGLAG